MCIICPKLIAACKIHCKSTVRWSYYARLVHGPWTLSAYIRESSYVRSHVGCGGVHQTLLLHVPQIFQIKFNLTYQARSTPKIIGILTKVFCTFGPNLVILAWTVDDLHQPRLWFITGGYLVKRWFIPAAARARGQSNDLYRGILASNLFNCHNEVINAPPIPSISRCIHIVYRHKTYENISGRILFITAWVLFFTMFVAKMPSSTAAPLAVKGANH